ncbi:glutathione peroxidase [Halotalea alkalilenta]|uniref:Glutathione peroxidase n=1 Tax=Halotalea alkalilenta TaxID=376489 RepID=A0A172YID0_9GAMM|nr:glutathione peroxidase [Halotalea alkalilenta]ANF58984.1 glutathione peroxidase [Halotalea alkalilenta]
MAIYDHPCRTLGGEPFNLHALRGQVLLVVNVASRCGFTPQLRSLERLYSGYRDQGFVVLGFPCDQFGHQAPEEGEAFAEACARFNLSFPLLEKVNVNGRHAHPLFVELRNAAPGLLGTRALKWNFTKFLVGRDGRVIKRYAPSSKPNLLSRDIERALEVPPASL